MIKSMKQAVIITVLLGLTLSFSVNADVVSSDVQGLVCNTLSSLGLSCGGPVSTGYQPGGGANISGSNGSTANPATNGQNKNNGGTADGSNLTAAIYTAGKKSEGSDSVNLVRVKGRENIYEIVGGKKHFIPTMDIFYDYGFQLGWVQDISQKELDKFPRVKLMQVAGDKKKTYYFTEGGMVRFIPDKSVFNSYGDREEDVIIISKKEFNYYPQNQFVFLENPLNRDVYQIVDGKVKRYITPMAIKRLKIREFQIAPINQSEVGFYKTGAPVIL